jgi:hypothetical protein
MPRMHSPQEPHVGPHDGRSSTPQDLPDSVVRHLLGLALLVRAGLHVGSHCHFEARRTVLPMPHRLPRHSQCLPCRSLQGCCCSELSAVTGLLHLVVKQLGASLDVPVPGQGDRERCVACGRRQHLANVKEFHRPNRSGYARPCCPAVGTGTSPSPSAASAAGRDGGSRGMRLDLPAAHGASEHVGGTKSRHPGLA